MLLEHTGNVSAGDILPLLPITCIVSSFCYLHSVCDVNLLHLSWFSVQFGVLKPSLFRCTSASLQNVQNVCLVIKLEML